MNRIAPYLALAALLGVVYLLTRISALEDQLKAAHGDRSEPVITAAPEVAAAPRIETAQYMVRIQQYAHKLWWAGQAGNLPLANFYRHEMKEDMETVANAGIVDDGVPVSENMKTYGLRASDALKEQLKTDGLKDFSAHYEALISTCNTCHRVSGHPELRMQVPTENRFSDQDFTPHP
jgi:hypothetical protein